MHKKYYFALALILLGLMMGILTFAGLRQTGFNNRGVPMVAVLGVSVAFIVGGLLFIIFGNSEKK